MVRSLFYMFLNKSHHESNSNEVVEHAKVEAEEVKQNHLEVFDKLGLKIEGARKEA